MNFAKKYINWSVGNWKSVLFSNESKFNLWNTDGVQCVRRTHKQSLNPRFCKSTLKHGGGSVMIWTCFSGYGIGPFHEIGGIMDRFVYKDIVENVMLPYAEWNMTLSWVFQHDNDPKHTSKLVKEWLTYHRIEVLDWPAQSPDLNPIENLFGILKRRVGTIQCKNQMELINELKIQWENIPAAIISNLIESMSRRCAEVIKNNGYYTNY